VRQSGTLGDCLGQSFDVKYTCTDRLEVKITSLFPKAQKKSKKSEKSDGILSCLCREGLLGVMIEEYIFFCNDVAVREASRALGDAPAKKSAIKAKFPNVAGFCRFMQVGVGEFEELSQSYPAEYEQALSVFEDEALNSDLSSALLSSYMKKRLFYEKPSGVERKGEDSPIKICFEHDIFGDGE